jgi:MYXO-CTERM domain-containing protein
MTALSFHPRAARPLLVALLAVAAASSAQALAPAEHLTPLSSNTTAPSDWRIQPGQLFNGVAALDASVKLTWSPSAFTSATCSGSLLAGGAYVLTAAHCADSLGSATMTLKFGFSNGASAFTRTANAADVTLHPLWQSFKDSADAGSDLALIKLSSPVDTIAGYHLSTTNDIGKQMLIGGYGTTGTGGGNSAPGWGDSRYGHYAFNTFDVDSKTFNLTMNGAVPDWGAEASYYTGTTYMFDFDDAMNRDARNTLQRIADSTGNQWSSNTGVSGEGMIASGDSGGGDLVWNGSEWLLSAVHSWGWDGNASLGDGACDFVKITDCSPLLANSSSFGDLGGSTALFDQVAWIAGIVGSQVITAVPETGTVGLWLAGLAGLAARRRRAALPRGR